MSIRSFAYFCALASLFLTVPAFAATSVEVGTCDPSYIQFSTIQAAVNASPSGTTVFVCPGSYPEQVMINKPLTLRGFVLANASGAVITTPAGGVVANANSLTSGLPIAAQVLVQNTNKVTISNITIDGTNNGINDCNTDLIGIYYQNASGIVMRTGVLNEVESAGAAGCQSGLGIFAQSGSGGNSVVTVMNSVVENYQKNGITGNEIGTSITITGNTVLGQGPTTGAAENSIQIGFGATGTVASNTVGDDIWSPDTIGDPGDAAAGILVYASSGVPISSNVVNSTQFGIAVVSDATYGTADGSNISSNKVAASHIFDGIDVCSNNNSVNKNIVNGSDEAAIHLDSSCGGSGSGNSVANNTISVACAGILEGTGTTNSIGVNTFYTVLNTTLNADSCTTPPSGRQTAHRAKFRPVRP